MATKKLMKSKSILERMATKKPGKPKIPTKSLLEGAMADTRAKLYYTAHDWKLSSGLKRPQELRLIKVKKANSHKRELVNFTGPNLKPGTSKKRTAAEVVHWLEDGRQVRHLIEVIEPS